METITLAIDLGGTNTKFGLVTDENKIVADTSIATQASDGPSAAVARWAQAVEPWLKTYKIAKVGIGSPGPLDTEKGIVLETPNLPGWKGFHLTESLSQALNAPCFLEKDANCSALGEWAFSKVTDLVVITLGTGVGTGVIAGNQLLRGCKGLAVEAGHMVIDHHGPICGCGRHGCVEAFVGGRSFVAQYNALTSNPIPPLDSHQVFSRAKTGDVHAKRLVEAWVEALAVGVGNIVNIFNPAQVILTGGVSAAFNEIKPQFTKILEAESFKSSLKSTEVVVSKLQERAALIGAALWARQQDKRNERNHMSLL